MTASLQAEMAQLLAQRARTTLGVGGILVPERGGENASDFEGGDSASNICFPSPVCLRTAGPPEPILSLAKGLLLESTISCLAGPDESYKSTFALATAVAVAGGLPVFGAFATGHPRAVLLVSEEDDRDVIHNRVDALIRGMEWQAHREQILSNLHVHALDGLLLDDIRCQTHLLKLRESLGIELMIFDPLADLMQGEENSAGDARLVKRLWRQLIAKGCAIIVVMHLGKPKEGGTVRDRLRGSSAWSAAMRTVYGLKWGDAAIEVECLKMSRTRRPDPFRVEVEVVTEEGNPAMWQAARLTLAGQAGDWKVAHRRALTPTDRKALQALDGFREEPLSWTRWLGLSGLSQSTLGNVRRRLLDLKFVDATATETDRFKKRPSVYAITETGRNALLGVPDTETPPETPTQTPGGVSIPDTQTPLPPIRGVCQGVWMTSVPHLQTPGRIERGR